MIEKSSNKNFVKKCHLKKPSSSEMANGCNLIYSFNKIKELSIEALNVFKNRPKIPEEFSPDLEKIEKSFDGFFNLLELEFKKTIKNLKNLKEDDVKKTRHDLRGQIGSVKSYSDLILEELEDFNHTEDQSKFLNDLSIAANDVLPYIANIGICYEEEKEEIKVITEEEKEDYYEEDSKFRNISYKNFSALVIDDSAHHRDILERRLKKYDLNVYQAEDGEKGLEEVKKHKVDLILLDIMMPGLNGYQVLEILKNDKTTSDIPVIMISAINEVDSIVKCIQNGADDYLSTPFNPTILSARVHACLEKKQLLDQQKEKKKELESAQKLLKTAIKNMSDGFAIISNSGNIEMYNDQFVEIYDGINKCDEKSIDSLLKYNIAHGAYRREKRRKNEKDASFVSDEKQFDIDKKTWFSGKKYLVQLANGKWIEFSSNKTPSGYVSVHKDVTESQLHQQQLQYQALHDVLTGLPNRAAFIATLEKSEKKSKGNKIALLYLDLDGFKGINDSMGHEAGDDLLKLVSGKFMDNIRDKDMVARMGGDEFAIILNDIESIDTATDIASRILKDVGDEFSYEGHTLPFGVSIGIAVHYNDDINDEEFIKKADSAMYEAKNTGKGQYKIYGSY